MMEAPRKNLGVQSIAANRAAQSIATPRPAKPIRGLKWP